MDVRIVDLPTLRVAVAHGFGRRPELDAWATLRSWLNEAGPTPADRRWFGFNDPDPSPGRAEYGYRQWVTVPADAAGSDDVHITEIPGGRYAVLRCDGLDHIGERWGELWAWVEASGHRVGPGPALEECLTPPIPDEPARYVFDLYVPLEA